MREFDAPNQLDETSYVGAKMASVPTIKQRISLAVQQAEERLTQVKRAQEIFDKHPELEELLNIMQKSHF